MRQLVLGVTLAGALGLLQLMAGAQAQAPAAQTPAPPPGRPTGRARRHRPRPPIPTPATPRPARPASRLRRRPAPTARRRTPRRRSPPTGPFDPATWKYGTAFNPPAERRDLESGEAEDAAGRQGHRRDAVRRDRPEHLLRDGQRRLRLHLDRDAARPARLAGGGADVAHVPDTRRRCRACAWPTPTSARFSTRSTPARWCSSCRPWTPSQEAIDVRELGLLPAARPPQQRRRTGLRRRHVGQRARRLSQHDQRQHRRSS